MAPETVSEEVAEVNQAKKEEGGKSICLDLINRVPDELWTEVHDTVQETGIKTILMEKKCKRAKWLSGEALQTAVKRREAKSKGKRKDISI